LREFTETIPDPSDDDFIRSVKSYEQRSRVILRAGPVPNSGPATGQVKDMCRFLAEAKSHGA